LSLIPFIGFFIIGTLSTLFAVVMPDIIRGYSLTLTSAGLIFPVSSIGAVAGNLLAGVASDRIGRKPFLCTGAVVSCLGLLATAAAPSWALFVAGYTVFALGQGSLTNSINALVLDISTERRGTAMNQLHGTFGLGSMASPFLIRLALGPATDLRQGFVIAALVCLAFGVLALWAPAGRVEDVPPAERKPHWELLRSPDFAMIFCVGFFYNGVSWGLLSWIKVRLQQAGGSSDFGSLVISLFYVGLTTGRFACACLAERWTYGRTLVICATGAVCAYPLVVFAHGPTWVALGVLLTGLFQSGLYPTGLAYATRLFPTMAGAITGTMSVAMTAGSALPPWWTGALGDAVGLATALRINGVMLLPLWLMCLALMTHERRAHAVQHA